MLSRKKIENLKKLIEAKNEYIKLMSEELNELAVLASNRGWKSSRYEAGKAIREKISQLESKLFE